MFHLRNNVQSIVSSFMNMNDLERAKNYCAYQERCHYEVRSKLLEWKIYGDDLEEIIVELIKENFLSEERFAKAYASGKFNINQWGRNKIKMALKAKHVSEYCIRKGLEVISPEDYEKTIRNILAKRSREKKTHSPFQLSQYLVSRGFEYGLVSKILGNESE